MGYFWSTSSTVYCMPLVAAHHYHRPYLSGPFNAWPFIQIPQGPSTQTVCILIKVLIIFMCAVLGRSVGWYALW